MREADVDLGSGTVIDAGEELDVKKADRSVWLGKVPTFVKNVWTAAVAKPTYLGEAAGLATGSGTHLGTVCLAFDPTAKDGALPHASLHLNQAQESGIPADYELTFQPGVAPMHIFSRDVYASGRMAVEGKVEYKLDAKPLSVEDEAYNELSKKRMQQATKKTRQVQMLSDQKARGAIMRPLPVNASGKGIKSMGGNKGEERRARMEREALLDCIFKLFERQSYWSFKQLVAETNQPAVWLKEVLQDVCRFNKRGPNAERWEVKPEYRHARTKDDAISAKKPKLEA
mmetsp:Transcript_40929/g.76635  ORF Transcript_40929/g.76635 Transcript_40929/m.76635 type:complete len:286 (+) Transcript_40929:253-1110(+)